MLSLAKKIANKRVNAKKEGIPFKLTARDIRKLLAAAGISSEQWGFADGGMYVLARRNDTGAYEAGNCYFITQAENMRERAMSVKNLAACRANVAKAIQAANTGEAVARREVALQESFARRRIAAAAKAEIRNASLHPSFRGARNSQYGTMWLTNGEVNIKVRSDAAIPEGFRKGRSAAFGT